MNQLLHKLTSVTPNEVLHIKVNHRSCASLETDFCLGAFDCISDETERSVLFLLHLPLVNIMIDSVSGPPWLTSPTLTQTISLSTAPLAFIPSASFARLLCSISHHFMPLCSRYFPLFYFRWSLNGLKAVWQMILIDLFCSTTDNIYWLLRVFDPLFILKHKCSCLKQLFNGPNSAFFNLFAEVGWSMMQKNFKYSNFLMGFKARVLVWEGVM